MIIPDLLVSLIISLLLSLAFAAIIRHRGPRSGFPWFFLLIFLGTWAIGTWVRPLGPASRGESWFVFLIAGLIVALLATFTALRQTPEEPYHLMERHEQLSRNETMDLLDEIGREKEAKQLTYITLGVFFWLLLILLLVMIASRYVFY